MTHPFNITDESIPRMIPNPAWNDSVEFQQAKASASWFYGECPEDVFPEDYGKALPEAGGWIILLQSIHVGKALPDGTTRAVVVPHLSIWFAMPHITGNKKVLRHSGRKSPEITAYLKQAIIQTADGAVHVWPHEYNLCPLESFLEFDDSDGLDIHFLSSDGGFDEAQLFYIRSRGVSKADAQRMLLSSLRDPYYCYFTFSQDVVGCFSEGAGTGRFYPHNHDRRAAARSRKNSMAGTNSSAIPRYERITMQRSPKRQKP